MENLAAQVKRRISHTKFTAHQIRPVPAALCFHVGLTHSPQGCMPSSASNLSNSTLMCTPGLPNHKGKEHNCAKFQQSTRESSESTSQVPINLRQFSESSTTDMWGWGGHTRPFSTVICTHHLRSFVLCTMDFPPFWAFLWAFSSFQWVKRAPSALRLTAHATRRVIPHTRARLSVLPPAVRSRYDMPLLSDRRKHMNVACATTVHFCKKGAPKPRHVVEKACKLGSVATTVPKDRTV